MLLLHIISGLASWLEYFFEQGYDKKTEFAFGSDGEDCPYRINARASDLLRTIFGTDQFGEVLAEAERERVARKVLTQSASMVQVCAPRPVLQTT